MWNIYHYLVLGLVDPVGILLITSAYIYIGQADSYEIFYKFFDLDTQQMTKDNVKFLM